MALHFVLKESYLAVSRRCFWWIQFTPRGNTKHIELKLVRDLIANRSSAMILEKIYSDMLFELNHKSSRKRERKLAYIFNAEKLEKLRYY